MAHSIAVPFISVSEDLSVIAVYYGPIKHPLELTARLLNRANQALQTLERYKNRLDAVAGTLTALEVENLVTVRDVVTVLQRTTDIVAGRRLTPPVTWPGRFASGPFPRSGKVPP